MVVVVIMEVVDVMIVIEGKVGIRWGGRWCSDGVMWGNGFFG